MNTNKLTRKELSELQETSKSNYDFHLAKGLTYDGIGRSIKGRQDMIELVQLVTKTRPRYEVCCAAFRWLNEFIEKDLPYDQVGRVQNDTYAAIVQWAKLYAPRSKHRANFLANTPGNINPFIIVTGVDGLLKFLEENYA